MCSDQPLYQLCSDQPNLGDVTRVRGLHSNSTSPADTTRFNQAPKNSSLYAYIIHNLPLSSSHILPISVTPILSAFGFALGFAMAMPAVLSARPPVPAPLVLGDEVAQSWPDAHGDRSDDNWTHRSTTLNLDYMPRIQLTPVCFIGIEVKIGGHSVIEDVLGIYQDL